MKRVFIAVEIPEKIKEEILKIQKQLLRFNGKLTERENFHLTLKFIGEISEEKIEKIKEKLREIKFKPFEAVLGKIGFFEKGERGIIWINLANCNALQKEVDKKLEEFFEKEKRFMSHLTLARVKNVKNRKEFMEELNKIKISPLEFHVGEFILKESIPQKQKHIYKDLKRYKLI